MSIDPKSDPCGGGGAAKEEAYARPVLDDVLRDEAEFSNRDYARHAHELAIEPSMFVKYTDPMDLWDWRQMAAILLGNVSGRELLDYGCGMGEESVYFAKLGAKVTSIDISDVGIATAKRRAAYHGVDLRAYEMRCDPTSFPAASFDLIHGMGILHHVGIEPGLAEVWRLLRPGGVGVFLEPMGDHPGIEAVKDFIMKHGRFLADFDPHTDHEHNLTWKEIEDATRRFARTRTYPYHLLYRAKRFLPRPEWAHNAARRLDQALLAVAPFLRRYVGAAVIQVMK